MALSRTPRPVTRGMRDIGTHLQAWRKLRHLTVSEVADRAGVSTSTVARLEGGSGVSLENVLRVARALGVLQELVEALDPYRSDVGRLRADQLLPERVRRRSPGRANLPGEGSRPVSPAAVEAAVRVDPTADRTGRR